MLTGIALTLIVEVVVGALACVRYRVRLTYTHPGWFAEGDEPDA